MATIHNRFKVLLAQKELRDGRKYTYEDIYNLTGVAPKTIGKYVNNEVARFDSVTITALCDWLDCNLNDLLIYPIPPEVSQQTLQPQELLVPAM